MCFVKLLAVISIVAVAGSALAVRIAGHYMSE